jgi:uncharacterized protein (TIGR03435 family)
VIATRSALALAVALATGAQRPTVAVQPVAFEVASVKLNPSPDGERDVSLTASQLRLKYATGRDLIQFAYLRSNGNLRGDAEVLGGPGWLGSSHFDIVATVSNMPGALDAANTAAGATTVGENTAIDRVRLMMQTLLADRFKLVVRHEMRDLPVYELAFARTDRTLGRQFRKVEVNCAALRQSAGAGAADTPVAPCGGLRRVARGHFQGHAVSVGLLAGLLEGIVQRNVVDRTALPGVFDVDLQFVADPLRPADPTDALAAGDGPSIFTAVREQLGLALNASRAMVDVLVIDRAEAPTPD